MLRFPVENYSFDLPWLLFTSYEVDYAISGKTTKRPGTADSVALYMPTNFSINDQLTYSSHQGGWAQGIAGAFEGRDDFLRAAGEVGASLGARGARSFAQGVSDFLTPGADVTGIWDRSRGRVTNPNEFIMFQSPSIRTFSFNFELMPESREEADVIPRIIKFFRLSAYPDISSTQLDYIFPKVFKILVVDPFASTIFIPEVACESVGVAYNPDSMSFFSYNNMPVKVNLSLTFKELQPISKTDIEAGF